MLTQHFIEQKLGRENLILHNTEESVVSIHECAYAHLAYTHSRHRNEHLTQNRHPIPTATQQLDKRHLIDCSAIHTKTPHIYHTPTKSPGHLEKYTFHTAG